MTESRKRRASTELQFETEIVDLPEEILVGIFKHLDKSDLLALTLQNKQFNRIISDGFMHVLKLYITPQNLDTAWIGSRKYTTVKFKNNCTDSNVMDFMNILTGIEVKALSMPYDLTINPFTLKVIMSMCKNLKVFHLPRLTEAKMIAYRSGNRTESVPENFWRNLPSLDLKELKCNIGDGRTLQLLLASNTENFTFENVRVEDADLLGNFLKVQKNLKNLHLHSYVHGTPLDFLTTDKLNKVNFRLNSLKLDTIQVSNIQNFYEFINNHADTLTHVHLISMPISLLNNFRSVTKIKKFIFHNDNSTQDYDNRENVEELDIVTCSGFDLAVKFPNLMRIKVKIRNSAGSLRLSRFSKLTHLEVFECNTIEDLTISGSTKFIRFESYTFAAMPNFEHFQFDEIELKNCKNVDWLAEFLAKDETRVKKLTINALEMSSQAFMMMLEHKSKVTKFDMNVADIKFL